MAEIENIKEQKRDIPAFSDETGSREIDIQGKSILEITNESLIEYRTSIKSEIAKLESRITALEMK